MIEGLVRNEQIKSALVNKAANIKMAELSVLRFQCFKPYRHP